MISERDVNLVKETAAALLQKMSAVDLALDAKLTDNAGQEPQDGAEGVIAIDVTLKEPKFFIGKDGQTLLDLQRILRMISNKMLQKRVYIKLDINSYQKQKTDYLRNLATSLADEVVLTKKEKSLPPMASFERRIIHEELSHRKDIVVRSQGEGEERRIVIGMAGD